MKQQELAELADISAAYLSQIEGGKKDPSMEVLGRLASALEVTPGQLLGTETPPTQGTAPEGLNGTARSRGRATPRGNVPSMIRSRDDIEQALRSSTAVASIVHEARHSLDNQLADRLEIWAAVAEDFCRLLEAYASGIYRAVPWDELVLMTAALAYVSEPDDMTPDHLTHGHLDDMAILAFTESLVRPDLEAFRAWEERSD